jgi:hypothetical protein
MSIVGMVWTVHSTAINIIENIGGLALGIGIGRLYQPAA